MISGKVIGLGKIGKKAAEVQAAEARNIMKAERFAIALMEYIEKNLRTVLDERKMAHFAVEYDRGYNTFRISFGATDNVGGILYFGSGAYTIAPGKVMYIPEYDKFTMTVSHPGIKALEPEIDQVIRSSFIEAAAVVGGGIPLNISD